MSRYAGRTPAAGGRAILAFAMTCLLAAGMPPALAAPAPDSFTSDYQVSRSVFSRLVTLAEARLALTRQGGGDYRYVSHTWPIPIIAFVYGDEVVEQSSGRFAGDAVRPDRYDYELKGRSGHADHLVFERDKGEVEQSFKDDTVRQRVPPSALDRLSMQLAIMADLARGAREMRYLVADRNRLYAYRFSVAGNERVSTPFGEFEAVKVEMAGQRRVEDAEGLQLDQLDIVDKDGNGGRTTFWCAPALGFVPVQVEYADRDQGVFRMDIQSLERPK
jgi:hypothetical protein